jgi:hypothetical protein
LWSLRFDLLSAKLLVWVASIGRDAELRPETHLYTALWVAWDEDWTRLVNVEDHLRASLGSVREIDANGHRYFEPMQWTRNDRLLFRVRAYDSEPKKQYLGVFRYDLTGMVSREPQR